MIYYISDNMHIKVGLSHNPQKRLKQLQTGSSNVLTLLAVEDGDIKTEEDRHITFAESRIGGEWFMPSDKLIGYINSISTRYYVEVENGKIMKYMKMQK